MKNCVKAANALVLNQNICITAANLVLRPTAQKVRNVALRWAQRKQNPHEQNQTQKHTAMKNARQKIDAAVLNVHLAYMKVRVSAHQEAPVQDGSGEVRSEFPNEVSSPLPTNLSRTHSTTLRVFITKRASHKRCREDTRRLDRIQHKTRYPSHSDLKKLSFM